MNQEKQAKTTGQECSDFATSLRSAAAVVKIQRGTAPESFISAAELFEKAALYIADLEAQLSAIVAGGVEALRKRECVQKSEVARLVQAAQALVLDPASAKKKLELEAVAWGPLAALQAAPPAPAAVAVPDDEFQLRQLDLMQDVLDAKDTMLAAGVERNDFPTMFRQYSALAAAPAQGPSIEDLCARIKAADDAAADNDYMLDSDDCIKVLRGQWKGPLAMDKPDAPAQAVAVPTSEEVLQLRMLVLDAICALETVPVTVSCGLDPSESAKASAENIERKLASIPAQEHATQLAGQDGEQDEGLAQAIVERDAAFEAVRNRLCGLQRYSFVLDDDGVVRRAQDRTGNWIEFDDAHELFDPVAVDAAIAAQDKDDAARAAQKGGQ